ncbi:MAG: hypothetical protein JNL60_14680 [Bacteroidia bacterium]|nr:hypothetical protein [Bacteroidia bacterium]
MESESKKGSSRDTLEKPRNKKDLAALLGVTPKVLRMMIKAVEKELGEPIGGVYCVRQVLFMVEKYGAKK